MERIEMVAYASEVTNDNDLRHKRSVVGREFLIKLYLPWPRREPLSPRIASKLPAAMSSGFTG